MVQAGYLAQDHITQISPQPLSKSLLSSDVPEPHLIVGFILVCMHKLLANGNQNRKCVRCEADMHRAITCHYIMCLQWLQNWADIFAQVPISLGTTERHFIYTNLFNGILSCSCCFGEKQCDLWMVAYKNIDHIEYNVTLKCELCACATKNIKAKNSK